MDRRWLYLGLPLLTLLVYLYLMLALGLPLLRMTNWAVPFDLRLQGYDAASARTYLAALSPEARAMLLGPVRRVDTLIPVLLALVLMLPLWHRRRPTWQTLPALAFCLLDLSENAAVAALLRGGGAVDVASNLTQAKFAALAIANLLAIRALRR